MTNASLIQKVVSPEQKSQDNKKIASSPFRYNTPYSNLYYEKENKSHQTEEVNMLGELVETDLDGISHYLEFKLSKKTRQLKEEVQELVLHQEHQS